MSSRAWVDESIHAPTPEAPGGMYILAAVIADLNTCEAMRDVLRALTPRRAFRLHWRKESALTKRKITDAISACDFTTVVVVGIRPDKHNPERARRKCMERLLWDLDQLGVSDVWIESRTASLNTKDRTMVAALRSAQRIPAGLRTELEYPSVEPMLWAADAIAGMVGMARKGVDVGLRDTMGTMIREIEIEVRRAAL